MKTEFKISVDKIDRGRWSFGMCLAHDEPETYLFVNLFKWSISIGRFICDF